MAAARQLPAAGSIWRHQGTGRERTGEAAGETAAGRGVSRPPCPPAPARTRPAGSGESRSRAAGAAREARRLAGCGRAGAGQALARTEHRSPDPHGLRRQQRSLQRRRHRAARCEALVRVLGHRPVEHPLDGGRQARPQRPDLGHRSCQVGVHRGPGALPGYGTEPVSSWKSTQPSAYWSVRPHQGLQLGSAPGPRSRGSPRSGRSA